MLLPPSSMQLRLTVVWRPLQAATAAAKAPVGSVAAARQEQRFFFGCLSQSRWPTSSSSPPLSSALPRPPHLPVISAQRRLSEQMLVTTGLYHSVTVTRAGKPTTRGRKRAEELSVQAVVRKGDRFSYKATTDSLFR